MQCRGQPLKNMVTRMPGPSFIEYRLTSNMRPERIVILGIMEIYKVLGSIDREIMYGWKVEEKINSTRIIIYSD